MGKGYDSESIHKQIREEIKSYSIIPVRDRMRKQIKGKYRRELNRDFDKTLYNKRNPVETVFSVLKRKLGEAFKARKYWFQVKEVKIKLIVYNIQLAVNTIFISILKISTRPKSEWLFITWLSKKEIGFLQSQLFFFSNYFMF
ncbi:transposase IS4 family protein [Methanolacinia petrolearia DSM 11571]|uniref:Transposase IS4 family protein n=1 Tax=Methanolacinia petrolearia (strain DSM 11571 / OCM 486 / SEBR 4847) TaxID=679926 RepID=E1REY7_METP4|nr:transposase [Methanolacinia petrolearia]ADN36158.1 transposase IS4 family protein [Methanolacinia petrolearia DSM 11571]